MDLAIKNGAFKNKLAICENYNDQNLQKSDALFQGSFFELWTKDK